MNLMDVTMEQYEWRVGSSECNELHVFVEVTSACEIATLYM